MVYKWGMSDKVGMIYYGSSDSIYEHDKSTYSDKTAEMIDEEVKMLIDDSYAKALRLIVENKDAFERITKALLEFETLNKDQLDKIMRDAKLDIEC